MTFQKKRDYNACAILHLDLWLEITKRSTAEVRLVKPVHAHETVLCARRICLSCWMHGKGVDRAARLSARLVLRLFRSAHK